MRLVRRLTRHLVFQRVIAADLHDAIYEGHAREHVGFRRTRLLLNFARG